MFKHSLIRRADGDDITIWVDNSFEETPSAAPANSCIRRHLWASGFDSKRQRDSCGSFVWKDDTTKDSPTTGSVHEIASWLSGTNGGFFIRSNQPDWQRFITAGNKQGTNAHFSMKLTEQYRQGYVGTNDILYLAAESLRKYQRQFSGKWRVGAWGDVRCNSGYSLIGVSPLKHPFYWLVGGYYNKVPNSG